MIITLLKKIFFFGLSIYNNFLMKLSSKFPINSKRIYISSFFGKYCDSPKVIALSLARSFSDLEIVYQVNRNHKRLPKCIKCSIKNSIKDIYYRATARIIIDNNYGGNAVWLKDCSRKSRNKFQRESSRIKNRDQTVISTWHGTPLKKMGIDAAGSQILDFDCPNTIFVLGNQWTANVMKRLTFNKVPINITGSPRNDALINKRSKRASDLKRKMGIDASKKVLLYAPTFRDADGEGSSADIANSGIKQLKQLDFNKLSQQLSAKFGGEWIFILRFHHYVEKKIDWGVIRNKYGENVINGNNFEDMADYLQITDILVTDASSTFFDFALTKKPCFLFFPDSDQYSKNRGLYFDFTEMPFPMSKNFDELSKTITNFNEKQYKEECCAFLDRIGNADDGRSTRRIVKIVENILSEGK